MYYISQRHLGTKRWIHERPGFPSKKEAEKALTEKLKHHRYEYRIVYSPK